MSITLAAMKTAIGRQFKQALTTKDADATDAVQYVLDDIIDDFINSRDLKDETSWLSCTLNQSYVELSSALSGMYGNRIRRLVMKNTANNDDDKPLDEIDFESKYLDFNANADSPDSEHYGVPYEYARYEDRIYLKWVPDESTYQIKIFFEKTHPQVSTSQDILFPADFKSLILHGALFYLYSFVERKDGLALKHQTIYEDKKESKIINYQKKPSTVEQIKTDWK